MSKAAIKKADMAAAKAWNASGAKVAGLEQEEAYQAVDRLWEVLKDHSREDLQEERDAVMDALDRLLEAAGLEAP